MTIPKGLDRSRRGASRPPAPAAPALASAGRILELDILRGIAILLVLAMHSPGERGESGRLHALDGLMHGFGWSGVDLFFVLSGFLIGTLLISEIDKSGEVDIRRFLVRRMLRIWPAYYCLIVVAFVRSAADSPGGLASSFASFWPALVHIQNFRGVPRPQLWTLAIEEHFYVLLPLLLWLGTRRPATHDRLRAIPYVGAGLVVGCLALRTGLFATTSLNVRRQTFLCIDALFFGVTLAYLRRRRPALLERIAATPGLLAIAVVLFLPALAGGAWERTIGYTALYLGYALVLIRFIYPARRGRVLNGMIGSRAGRLVGWIGVSSYSIYLWHYDLGWWGYRWTRRAAEAAGLPPTITWLAHTIGWFIASILTGAVLGRLIEIPTTRIRDRLFPSKVSANIVGESPSVPRLDLQRFDLDDGGEVDRAVDVREGLVRVADGLVDHRRGEQRYVDVQQEELRDAGVEALDNTGPLRGGAAMDVADVVQLDAASRAGVDAVA
jgi:peptidoglycan/LPS O-acetylase OafA/YrhL